MEFVSLARREIKEFVPSIAIPMRFIILYFQLRIATQAFKAVCHSVSHSLMSHFNMHMNQYDSEFSLLTHAHSQLDVSRPCLLCKEKER